MKLQAVRENRDVSAITEDLYRGYLKSGLHRIKCSVWRSFRWSTYGAIRIRLLLVNGQV